MLLNPRLSLFFTQAASKVCHKSLIFSQNYLNYQIFNTCISTSYKFSTSNIPEKSTLSNNENGQQNKSPEKSALSELISAKSKINLEINAILEKLQKEQEVDPQKIKLEKEERKRRRQKRKEEVADPIFKQAMVGESLKYNEEKREKNLKEKSIPDDKNIKKKLKNINNNESTLFSHEHINEKPEKKILKAAKRVGDTTIDDEKIMDKKNAKLLESDSFPPQVRTKYRDDKSEYFHSKSDRNLVKNNEPPIFDPIEEFSLTTDEENTEHFKDLPQYPARDICLLVQKHQEKQDLEDAYQIIEKIPMLAYAKKAKKGKELRQITFSDLISSKKPIIDLELSYSEVKEALGVENIEYLKPINLDLSKSEITLKKYLVENKFEEATRTLVHMLLYNGKYSRRSGPGYRNKTNLARALNIAFGATSKDRPYLYEIDEQILKETEEIIKQKSKNDNPGFIKPFTKYGEGSRRQIKKYLEKNIYGFGLVKFKNKEICDKVNNSLAKYIGIKTGYGTVKLTTTYFANYLYVGSKEFSGLPPYGCIDLLRKIMPKDTQDVKFAFDLSVPLSKVPSFNVKNATKSGIFQIRFNSFQDALKAYEIYQKSGFFDIIEFCNPRYSYFDGYHMSPEERRVFVNYDIKGQKMIQRKCEAKLGIGNNREIIEPENKPQQNEVKIEENKNELEKEWDDFIGKINNITIQ